MFHGRRPEERQHDRHPLTRSARIRACPVEYLLELCPLPFRVGGDDFYGQVRPWFWGYMYGYGRTAGYSFS